MTAFLVAVIWAQFDVATFTSTSKRMRDVWDSCVYNFPDCDRGQEEGGDVEATHPGGCGLVPGQFSLSQYTSREQCFRAYLLTIANPKINARSLPTFWRKRSQQKTYLSLVVPIVTVIPRGSNSNQRQF